MGFFLKKGEFAGDTAETCVSGIQPCKAPSDLNRVVWVSVCAAFSRTSVFLHHPPSLQRATPAPSWGPGRAQNLSVNAASKGHGASSGDAGAWHVGAPPQRRSAEGWSKPSLVKGNIQLMLVGTDPASTP